MDYDDESHPYPFEQIVLKSTLYALTGAVVITSFIRELGAFEK
jgi:hypothetical protein